MVKALFDTNILIDYLRGIPAASAELGRYKDRAISLVTWMEVLVGAPPAVRQPTRAFLDSFTVVPIDTPVAERAVAIRQEHRLRLPDAIVWASAQAHGMLLVTRDTKAFPADDPGIRVPYSI
jgi:predicted nucleic acid-binding protein